MNIFQKIKRRALWAFLSVLPKNQDKVFLESFSGRGYSDSPKAIADELLRRGSYKLYWAVSGEAEAKSLPEGITPVMPDSFKGIYHACTAGFWIDNCRKWSYVIKRDSQYYIQTWHGFPLKKIEKDAAETLDPGYVEGAKHDSAMCDLYLSDSKFLTDIYHSAFWYDGEVLEGGLPRNDMLLHEQPGIVRKVRTALRLPPPDKLKLVLYAPTFRRDKGVEAYDINYESLCAALSQRFGGSWLVLAKLHPNMAKMAKKMQLDKRFVMNASDYPDIHELYVACDAMVTDYSSTMFDYAITGKPCFLYVNDLEDYKNDRNFYFDINRLPFERAENTDELCEAVMHYDSAAQLIRTAGFFEDFGIQESGSSSAAVADKMDRLREINKGRRK